MTARAIEREQLRLEVLRREEWEDATLGALVLAASVVLAAHGSSFALPLFAGGLYVAARYVRAAWLRWDIVDRLLSESDAYVIPDVRARAARAATPENRRLLAQTIRTVLGEHRLARIEPLRLELSLLAGDLEDTSMELDPQAAVTCERLLHDPDSVLYADGCTTADVRARLERIRSGLHSRN